MKKLFLSLCILASVSASMTAQAEIPVMDFEDFKPYLHQEDDKLHLINFWATWCKPCMHEMPYFIKLKEEYPEEEIEITLVSLDFGSQIENSLKPYVIKHDLVDQVIVLDDPDANRWIDKVSEEWSGAIPFTMVYYGDQRKTQSRAFKSYQELRQFIDIKN